jgi:exosortase A-associated hydrolase 2
LIEPIFLAATHGSRFCLVHRPPAGMPSLGGIVYVHPFAEEMNKSRRIAATQSRALSTLGFTVLQMDLHGCGDSSGEMADVTIAGWRQDLDTGVAWMCEQGIAPLYLWGLRFGALLGLDWMSRSEQSGLIERVLLWQPVTSGDTHLSQFLRIGVASDMLSAGASSGGGAALRSRLKNGETVEIAGYDINPELAAEMAALKLMVCTPGSRQVDWIEVSHDPAAGLGPASGRVVEEWQQRGVAVHTEVVPGASFWSTVEITDCDGLIETTTRIARTQWQRHTTSAA